MQSLILIWLIVVNCISCSLTNNTSREALIQKIEVSKAVQSPFWSDDAKIEYYGDLVDVIKDSSQMARFHNFSIHYQQNPVDGGDLEVSIAVDHFFWGMTSGIVLELGAVDGVHMSQSLPMIQNLSWNRILVEGDPQHAKKLSADNQSLAYSCAICEEAQIVHFVGTYFVGGIVEFMNEDYLKTFHSSLLTLPKEKWTTKANVKEVHCIPLSWILEHRHIHHVNLFILDVEGGELSVLKSIDFNKVRFDVISVETDYHRRKRRPVGYVNEVSAFMAARGYRFVRGFGKNSWFVHLTFTARSKPGKGHWR